MRIDNRIFARRRTENAGSDCAHCMRVRRRILKSFAAIGAALFGNSITSSHAATLIKAEVKKPVSTKSVGTRPVRTKKEWWKTDPYARGPGIGIVIHQKGGTWVVARVLRGSPAARAGIRKGDRIKSINKYSYKSGNLRGLIHAVRRNKSRKNTVEVMRPGRKTAIFSLGSASMIWMIATNRWPSTPGGSCYFCRKGQCGNAGTAIGFSSCSCTWGCAVV